MTVQTRFRPARVAGLCLAAVLVLVTALTSGPADAGRVDTRRTALDAVPGEVIVKFRAGAELTRQVRLSAGSDAGQARQMLAERAAAMSSRLGRTLQAGAAVGERTQVLRASGISAAELAARLAADPDVEFAEPNQRMRRTAAPNDPLYAAALAGVRPQGPDSGQWYLRAPAATLSAGPVSSIDIEAAWVRSTGAGNVVVAVLDTGVRFDHPDLAGRLLPGYDFVSDAAIANDGDGRDADPSDPGDWVSRSEAGSGSFTGCGQEDSSWHGTATASLVGATAGNGVGMAGAAPGVSVLPLRVLGKCFGNSADIQAAMRWAAGIAVDGVPANPHPAKVLNLSLGGGDTCSAGYQAAVNEVLARGVVIVAAAGNSAGGPVGAPANCAGVIGVVALRHAGSKVGFSDLGPQISISAPGGNCINITSGSACLYPIVAATNAGSTVPTTSGWTDSFNASVGTSFASPLVAATAALMFSVQPGLTPAQVLSTMQATARPFPTTGGDNGDGSVVQQCRAPSSTITQLQCYCNTQFCGAGMLDAGAAVRALNPGAFVNISATPVLADAGQSVAWRITGLELPSGRNVQSYLWSLQDGGSTGTAGFTSSTNASTAALTPPGGGSLRVQLAVTDNAGASVSGEQVLSVRGTPVVVPPVTPPPAAGGGGGGGTMSAGWLAALALAVAGLFRAAPGRPRRA